MSFGLAGNMAITPEDEMAMNNLERLKELREITIHLNKVKSRLKREVRAMEEEKKCLQAYREEKESLDREKMAHVEELRLIHADINEMENVIKQSEEEHDQHLERAKHLSQEFQKMKRVADSMRDRLNLGCLPDLMEGEEEIRPDLLRQERPSGFMQSQKNVERSAMHNSMLAAAAANAQQSYLVASSRAIKPGLGTGPGVGIAPGSGPHHGPSSGVSGPVSERQATSAFRQQPPPMKSCLSCHQQIHRNAPICPLCKAKSRSRNPKKPKRKTED